MTPVRSLVYEFPSEMGASPNQIVRLFRKFISSRQSVTPSPGNVGPDQESFNRAWSDYVEWSGLDEAGLREALRDAAGRSSGKARPA